MRGRRGRPDRSGMPAQGGNRTKCDAHHSPGGGRCEMVLIKAKRLPPRLPRPQGWSEYAEGSPPSSPASAGFFVFRGGEAPASGLPLYRTEETGGSTWCLG